MNDTLILLQLTRKALESEYALPWAHEEYMSTDVDEGFEEYLEDIRFARALEDKGMGLRAKPGYRGTLCPPPEEVILSDRIIATAEEIEIFVRKNKLQFGNPQSIELRDAYQYLKLFEKYRQFHPLG